MAYSEYSVRVAESLFASVSAGCLDWWREQPLAYPLDFRGAKVVVVGGDCGTTAAYVLSRGAREVVAYERDEGLVRAFYDVVCRELGICDRVRYVGEFRGGRPEPGDILLVDCEGCEETLDLRSLEDYKAWCVAVHSWDEAPFRLLRALLDAGARPTYVSRDGKEMVVCYG